MKAKHIKYIVSFIAIIISIYSCKKTDYVDTTGRPTIENIKNGTYTTTPTDTNSTVNEAFTYTASGLDINFSTTKTANYYSWTFGDGNNANYLTYNYTSNTYSASGTYTAALSLYDASYSLTATYTRTISVSSSLTPYLYCAASGGGTNVDISSYSVLATKNTSNTTIGSSTNYGYITIVLPATISQGSTYTCNTYSLSSTSFDFYTNNNWTNIAYTDLYGYHPSLSLNTVSVYISAITEQGITGTFSGDVAQSGCTSCNYVTLSSGNFTAPY